MRSTRRRSVAIALKSVLTSLLVLCAIGSLAHESGSTVGISAAEAPAVEGWVADDLGNAVPFAQVILSNGRTATADGSGYFALSAADTQGALRASGDNALLDLRVSAQGYASWELSSARYFAGDTLRIYPKLSPGEGITRIEAARPPNRSALNVADVTEQVRASLAVNRELSFQRADLQGDGAGTVRALGSVSANAASLTPPSSIRVYRTGTGDVEVVPFREYVKHVLPNEWIPSWGAHSLRAGAMAVKEYGWFWVSRGGKQVALGADVKDNTEDQVYDPNVSYASTDAAVDATWQYVLLRNGALFQAQYCAGSYGPDPTGDCPWPAPYMTQWGSSYYADQGMSWDWILRFYYPEATLAPGGPNGAPPPPPQATPTRPAAFSVGQGASQPQVFVEAFSRAGGQQRLGRPTGSVRWWLTYVSEHNVLAQPFSGPDGQGGLWIVFDTLKSQIGQASRAFILEGKIAGEYARHTPPGPEWVGAPTSDQYLSVVSPGRTAQGFARGTLLSDGQTVAFEPWPSQFSGWKAAYYPGPVQESVSGPQLDIPGQPALVLDQPSPKLDWPSGGTIARGMGLGEGEWWAQFTREMQPEQGTYDVTLSADSGVRLWVDNLLAINDWTGDAHRTQQYNLDLDGGRHTVRIQYRNPGRAARLSFNMVKREPGANTSAAAPSPSSGATGGPAGSAGLRVKVTWLGRGRAPADSWAQPLTLMLSTPADAKIVGTYAGSTDRNGVALYSGLPEGTYNVHVKGPHSLQSARASIALSGNRTTEVDMKAQVEGDVNGDNCVTVEDFAIVQAMVGAHRNTPGWNSAADLDSDGMVTVSDVSLLRSGFDRCGDISADGQVRAMSVEGAPAFEQMLAPWLDPTVLRRDLSISARAGRTNVKAGEIVEVAVYAEAGTQPVDGGAFLLTFDAARLAPVDRNGNPSLAAEPGVALPSVLGNWIDAKGGTVGYAASLLQGTPPQGTVPLATLRFRALQPGTFEFHFASLGSGHMQLTNGGINLLAKSTSLTVQVVP